MLAVATEFVLEQELVYIRIDLAFLDPDPYVIGNSDPDPNPGARKLTKIN
jgi:hypothetical protein